MEKKFWFQLLGLVIIIMGATFLAFNYEYLKPFTSQFVKSGKNSTSVITGTKNLKIVGSDGTTKAELDIEVADTDTKRSKGLGFRESLATNSGMLFEHSKSQKFTYWMKGMQFPLDIMWLKGDKIADIIPNIPVPIAGQSDDTLERYSSTVEVNRVLETNAGFVSKNNIQIGDSIVLSP